MVSSKRTKTGFRDAPGDDVLACPACTGCNEYTASAEFGTSLCGGEFGCTCRFCTLFARSRRITVKISGGSDFAPPNFNFHITSCTGDTRP